MTVFSCRLLQPKCSDLSHYQCKKIIGFFKQSFYFFYTTDLEVTKLEGTTTIKKESKNIYVNNQMQVFVCKIFVTTGQI